jgi:fatty-acyl-CoA synthase
MSKGFASIVDCVVDHASHIPDRIALSSEARSVSYAELAAEVDTLAQRLLQHGVGKGDVVGVLSYPRIEAYQLHLALISIGGRALN